MNKNLVAGSQAGVDELQCRIDDLLWDVGWVRSIHEVQDKPFSPSRDEVFRVIFWGSSTPVAQSLTMVWLLAGMNDAPSCFMSDFKFVIVLVADVQVRVNLDHGGTA
ncbi:MAG TPA: hypothetical protein PLI76_01525 [Methanoculleus sp.]|nr:hypothetical protein [Methanoculleus sp.]